MMPGMTGIEFVKKLRSDPKYASVPFLLVTAEADGTSIDAAVKAGIDGFLQKPPNKDQLEQLFRTTAQILSQQGRAPALV
jgi:CheY-like chemotaxis protein